MGQQRVVGPKIVAGIDVGTQSVKVVLYDIMHHLEISAAKAPLDLIIGDHGAREQQASWWVQALRQCFDQFPKELKAQVVAVGVSGQQHGLVPLAHDGTVLAPVKLWNDTSTLDECTEIESVLGGRDAAIELAGNPILPGYTASKVLWLKKYRSKAYDALAYIMLPHDYINFYLTGVVATEAGDASGTGYFDIRKRGWSQPVLAAIDRHRDLAKALPPILGPAAVVGRVKPSVALELGLTADTIVSVGGGDNMMAAIGTGAVRSGALTISLGTSGTLFAYAPEPTVSSYGEFAAFCASTGGYLPLVCSLNCTSATELVRNMLGVQLPDFDSVVAGAEPCSGGVRSLPFFNGERTPECPKGTGTFLGLNPLNSTRQNILRSVVEATAYSLRYGLEPMRAKGLSTSLATITGGGAHSKQWLQILADVLDVEVLPAKHEEAAAFGAAIQALWSWLCAQGEVASIADLVGVHVAANDTEKLKPDRGRVATYSQGFRMYKDLVIMMQPSWAANS